MVHEFEVREEITLDATPEQVWEAIATGPGIDSWFMGRNEVEPREGGAVRMDLAGMSMQSTVTAYEPGKRLAFRGDPDPDGAFMAFEYLIEGRDGGTTVLRFVHNGFLGGDWEAEYDALRTGDRVYLEKLAVYLKHFPGRTATATAFLVGPQIDDPDRVWTAFGAAAGVPAPATVGDPARLGINGLPPADGVVAIVRDKSFLGVRTGDGLYLFIHGHEGSVVVEYHGFADTVTGTQVESAVRDWFNRVLESPAPA